MEHRLHAGHMSLPEDRRHFDLRRMPPLAGAVIVFTVVLAACFVGILLRGPGLLSSFWAANAVLLGLLISAPSLATASGILAAIAGYMCADMLTGSSLFKASLLTGGNLAGVLTGFALFRAIKFQDVRLSSPFSLGVVVAVALAASAASGVVGSVANPLLFDKPPLEGFVFWTVTEFTNFIAILPLLLTAPALLEAASRIDFRHLLPANPMAILPLATCIACMIAAPALPGASAIALPLPALVWCALVYGVPLTALLSFMCATWMLTTMTLGLSSTDFPLSTPHDLISLRVAVTLVCLPPVLIASIMRARSEALQEAAEARDAAEKAMSARTLLLATMAHELRTPLNSIVGLASLIEMQPKVGPTQADYKEYATHIRESGVHLEQLVNDLLDTAKVEAGEAQLTFRQTPSRPIIDQSLHLVRGLAMQARVTIKVTGDAWPDVVADQRAIKQVMINLLSNAVKYSPRNAIVDIATSIETDPSKGKRLVVRVSDSGPGISADDLKRLGRPYQRAQARGPRKAEGTGLGLALSMHLIRQHGGELRLESGPAQPGTVATFDLTVA